MNMSNELLWVLLLLTNYLCLLVSVRTFGKAGLYGWIVLASILANIQVIKTVELFGITTTLGNIVYGSSFLATDILGELWGKKDARRGVHLGIFSIAATTIVMQIGLWFTPSSSDITQEALTTIFSILPRITIASIIAYLTSQTFDVYFYNWLKLHKPKHLWLRNNLSTMVSQLVDNCIFTLIAFVGVFDTTTIVQIFISTYIMKWLVSLFDTPFMYLAVRWKEKIIDLSDNTEKPGQNTLG